MEPEQFTGTIDIIKSVKPLFVSSKSQWVPVVAAIGGALVGGIASTIPTALTEWRNNKRERDTLKKSLISEIDALLVIMNQRGYLNRINEIHEYLLEDESRKYKFYVQVPDHYSRIYQSQISHIGLLDRETASQIITFHQLIDSAVQDIVPGGLIAEHYLPAEAYGQLLSILNQAVSIGRSLTKKD